MPHQIWKIGVSIFEMFELAVWPRAVRYLETCKADLANVGMKLLVGGDGVKGTEQAGSLVFSRGGQKQHVWFREMPRKACRHVCFYPLYQLVLKDAASWLRTSEVIYGNCRKMFLQFPFACQRRRR